MLCVCVALVKPTKGQEAMSVRSKAKARSLLIPMIPLADRIILTIMFVCD